MKREVGEAPLFREDLIDLAPFAFRTAQNHCGECRKYHSYWMYERLAGLKGASFETERDILGALLREHAPQKGRVLVAGAADSGLLALIMQEAHTRAPTVTVADSCATPLVVCRRYAETQDLQLETVQQDLTKAPLPAHFDLVFAHNVLLHLRPDLWTPYLQHCGSSLKKEGSLILLHSMRPHNRQSDVLKSSGYATHVMAALADRHIALPQSTAEFQCGLESRRRTSSAEDLAFLELSLRNAGLAEFRRIDDLRRMTTAGFDPGEPKSVTTHIFVAKPRL